MAKQTSDRTLKVMFGGIVSVLAVVYGATNFSGQGNTLPHVDTEIAVLKFETATVREQHKMDIARLNDNIEDMQDDIKQILIHTGRLLQHSE